MAKDRRRQSRRARRQAPPPPPARTPGRPKSATPTPAPKVKPPADDAES